MRTNRGTLLVLAFAATIAALVLVPVSAAADPILSGTVRDHSSNPRAGVTVRIETAPDPGQEAKVVLQTVTGADGSYSFEVGSGIYKLSILANKAQTGLPSIWVLETQPFGIFENLVRDVSLPETAKVTAEALGEGGSPIPGATIFLAEVVAPSFNVGGYTASVHSRGLTGTTDAQGRISALAFVGGAFAEESSFIPPPGSEYGFTRFPSPPTLSGDATVVVHPPHVKQIGGTLRDASGTPIAGVLLGAKRQGVLEPTIFSQTAAAGTFSMKLLPGDFTLSSVAGEAIPGLPASWALETAPFTVTADATRDITLLPAATLTVRTVDRNGAPVAGAQVDLGDAVSVANLGGFPDARLLTLALRSETDAQGRVSFRVFEGASFGREGAVVLPPGSPYQSTRFARPPVNGDEEVVVHLASAAPGAAASPRPQPQPGTAAKAVAKVTLRSSKARVLRRHNVTFTARVSAKDGGAAPAGSVTFVSRKKTLGVAKLKNGVAKLATNELTLGKHDVVAVYSGDERFAAASSRAIVQTIVKRRNAALLS